MIRRAIGTTIAALCALTGPMAATALADISTDAPALSLSVSSARSGSSFTIDSSTSCPSEDGAQTVAFFFTDSTGTIFPIGTTDTDDDGSWSDAPVQLPVAGPDDSGDWQDGGPATGAGSVNAACMSSDDSGDPGDGDGGDGGDPGNGHDVSVHDVGDSTLTYADTPLTVTGAAAQFTLSVASDDSTVTVTPSESCGGTSAADVDLAVVPLGEDNADVRDNAGNTDNADPVATDSTTTAADGSWASVVLDLPDDTTGDFAVTVTCSHDGVVTSSYDAQPLALGTVLLSKPVCTARGAVAKVSGTYSGDVTSAGKPVQRGVVKLTGAGPWNVQLQSATTDEVLLQQTLTCSTPLYDLDVRRSGISGNGQVQVKVCNSGRAGVVAMLQVLRGKHGATVDTESLDPGECAVLQGGKVRRGTDVKAQVLINPPGNGTADTEVTDKFSVHRGKH